jgi:ribosomal protein L21E
MAEMVDMKLPKQTKKEMKDCYAPLSTGSPQEMWPYGLQIRFEKDEVKKMPGLKEYKVGEKVKITAEATVTSIRVSERQGGDEQHTVEMQIEKIACDSNKPLNKMSMKEYRTAREGKV